MAVRSGRGPSEKARIGPRGHNLDLGVYVIITLAGPALAMVGGAFSAWTVPSLVVTAIVSRLGLWQDRRTRDWLAAHRSTRGTLYDTARGASTGAAASLGAVAVSAC